MQLIKITVLVCVLTVRSCRSKIAIKGLTNSKSTSKLLNDVIHIVTSCYGDRINGIGLAGPLAYPLAKILTTEHLIPVVLFPTSTEDEWPPPHAPIQYRQKLQHFIFHLPRTIFSKTLDHVVKPSIWWNPMASIFFLVKLHDCGIDMISLALWQHHLIRAKIICCDRSGTVITVYNPFARQAPVPWKPTRVLKVYGRGTAGQFLNLFTSKYRRNKTICSSLDFDKMQDAHGYSIAIEGYPPRSLVPVRTKTNRAEYEYNIKMARLLEIVYGTMNVTPSFTYTERFSQAITKDMFAITEVIRSTWTDVCLSTYPHEQVGFVVVTQFRGHKAQLKKILSVTDIPSRIGLGVVYLVTLLFFKFIVHQALIPVFLNLIRITCNTNFMNLPDDNPTRIYLTSLLFFVVTMQGIYQGNLATLLTTRIPVQNVETMMDLLNLDYKLYGDPMVESIIEYPELRKRFVPVRLSACISHVLEDSSAACIAILSDKVLDKAQEFDLHLSSELIGTENVGFTIRWDWIFEERMNAILSRMVEADILEPWLHRCNPIKLIDFKYDKDVLSNTHIKILELGELSFAFAILGIGLMCSTVTFVLEIAIGKKYIMLRRDIVID